MAKMQYISYGKGPKMLLCSLTIEREGRDINQNYTLIAKYISLELAVCFELCQIHVEVHPIVNLECSNVVYAFGG